MKKTILEVATKKHVFAEISTLNKTLLVIVLLIPIAALVITNLLIQTGLRGALEMATVLSSPSPIQAKITVSEPSWFSTNAAPPAALGFTLTKGYAPFPVFFQGWESTVKEEIADYEWNFGDPNAVGKNSNILHGFNSAHVFEQPGIYNVTLAVKNRQGQISKTNISVEVVARPDARKYYIDSEIGDDVAYSGLCQTVSGTCGPWKTAERAFSNLHNKYGFGSSVLFKRGGSYPINTVTTTKVYIAGVEFGAYGDVAKPKPVIYWNGTTTVGIMIDLVVGSHDIAFTDLDLRFKNPAASARLGGLIRGIGKTKSLLLLRLDAQDMSSNLFGFSYIKNADPVQDQAIMTGVYMIDNSVRLNYYGKTTDDLNFKGAEMIYGFMGNLSLIGNTFDKSFNHIAYLSHLDKAVIVNNIFSRPASGRNALRISGDLVGAVGSNYVYVADNYFMGWRDLILKGLYSDNGGDPHSGNGMYYNDLLVTMGPNIGSDQSVNNVVFERNVLTNFLKAIMISDAENIFIRNNLFVTPNLQSSGGGNFVIGQRGLEKRPSKNITVVGNTFAAQSAAMVTTGKYPSAIIFISPYDRGQGTTYGIEHENISILNNIFYRPINSSVAITALSYQTNELMPQLHFDGNLYYDQAATDGKVFIINTGVYPNYNWQKYNLAEWRSLGFNYDASSQAQVAPLFNQSPVLASNIVGAPLTLAENLGQANAYVQMFKLKDDPANPAIDKGVDASGYLYYDLNGVERPDGSMATGAIYDVGAYEIVKAPALPNVAPTANMTLSATSGVAPATIVFDASGSTDPDGSIVSYAWVFGDGSSSSAINSSHAYAVAGTFQVTLTVTDNRGGTGSKSATISIVAPDTTAPVTTANSAGGTFNSSQIVVLTANEPATVYACLGSACTPAAKGASPVSITIDASTVLKYYSKDASGNTEAQKSLTFTINPICTPTYSCSTWSACSGGTQTRTCTNSCDSSVKTESQSCSISIVNGTGLRGSYFSNDTLSGSPSLVRTDATINFNWKRGAPAASIPKDNFSVRWEGNLNIKTAGTYTFFAASDDGARIWIDGQLLIDEWAVQSNAEYSADKSLSVGMHSIMIEYYEANTNASIKLSWLGPGIAVKQIIPQAVLYPASVSVAGIKGSYFANQTLSGTPAVIRIDPNINFTWSTGSPDPLIPTDGFSVRWEGDLQADTAGNYTFRTYTDDGVRLWIDGQLIIDQWHVQAPTAFDGSLDLSAGSHTIKMEYFEATSGATAQLAWIGPGIASRQIIPTSNLSSN